MLSLNFTYVHNVHFIIIIVFHNVHVHKVFTEISLKVLERSLKSVSYTHLDVYKRQGVTTNGTVLTIIIVQETVITTTEDYDWIPFSDNSAKNFRIAYNKRNPPELWIPSRRNGNQSNTTPVERQEDHEEEPRCV